MDVSEGSTFNFGLDETRGRSDTKSYRLILLENGLTCLLVSEQCMTLPSGVHKDDKNMDTRQAALAVAVAAGSYFDPKECQGCAHFLEHLLFMGSDKYPKENHFDEFVTENGGFSNAFTDDEETVYYFDINQGGIFQALDIITQFFVKPKLSPDAVGRELESIQSEFDGAKNHNGSRERSLLTYIADSRHPMSKFLWGSRDSINCEEPVLSSKSYALVREFWESHYRPQNMSLVLLSTFSLDRMEKEVRMACAPIRSIGRSRSRLPSPSAAREDFIGKMLADNTHLLPFKETGRAFIVVPTKQRHKLSIIFQLPSLCWSYESKPGELIAHLIGDERQGSILALLKEEGLANGLCAGAEDGAARTLFSISISLTKKGVRSVKRVTQIVFSYILLLRVRFGDCLALLTGWSAWSTKDLRSNEDIRVSRTYHEVVKKKVATALLEELRVKQKLADREAAFVEISRVYAELRDVSVFAFHYKEEAEAANTVVDLATVLLTKNSSLFRFTDLLRKDFLQEGLDLFVLKLILDSFSPEASIITLASSEFGMDQDYGSVDNEVNTGENPILREFGVNPNELRETAHFGCKFWEVDLELLCSLETPSLQDKLLLPRENVFIPTEFSLYVTSVDVLLGSYVALKQEKGFVTQCFKQEVEVTLFSGNKITASKDDIAILKSSPAPSFQLSPENISMIPMPLMKEFVPMDLLPRVVVAKQKGRVLVLPSLRFSMLPKARILSFVEFPESFLGVTANNFLCSLFMPKLFAQQFSDDLYAAKMAETKFKIEVTDNRFIFSVIGFSHKLRKFFTFLISSFFSFLLHPSTSFVKTFERVKESILKGVENIGSTAQELAFHTRMRCLHPGKHGKDAQLEALSRMELGDVCLFAKRLVEMSPHCLVFLHGNVDASWAKELETVIERPFTFRSKLVTFAKRVLRIPIGDNLVSTECSQASEENNCLEIYYDIGEDSELKVSVLTELVDHLMQEVLFDELRTKQQLGYVVCCFKSMNNGVVGFVVRIVSATHSCMGLLEKVDSFMSSFPKVLKGLGIDEKFERNRESLLIQSLSEPINLTEESTPFWREMLSLKENFLKEYIEACLLQGISLQEVSAFFRKAFLEERRRLIVCAKSVAPKKKQGCSKDYTLNYNEVGDLKKCLHHPGAEYYESPTANWLEK